jgi:hypothetical protein
MRKISLFILMITFGSVMMAQDIKHLLLNEKWVFGGGGTAFYHGTDYFFKSDGTFTVDYIYSGGQYIKTSTKGKYYYQPETQEVFLKFSKMDKAIRNKEWSPKKAMKVAFSAHDTIYTVTTHNDWEQKDGNYLAKGESTVFSFSIKLETELGLKLMNDTNGYKNALSIFDLDRSSFSREKIPDE